MPPTFEIVTTRKCWAVRRPERKTSLNLTGIVARNSPYPKFELRA